MAKDEKHQTIIEFQEKLLEYIKNNKVYDIHSYTRVPYNQIKSFAYGAALPRLDTYLRIMDFLKDK